MYFDQKYGSMILIWVTRTFHFNLEVHNNVVHSNKKLRHFTVIQFDNLIILSL